MCIHIRLASDQYGWDILCYGISGIRQYTFSTFFFYLPDNIGGNVSCAQIATDIYMQNSHMVV